MPLLLSLGCRDTYVLPMPVEINARPLALAGTGSTVLVGTRIDVNGSGSFDPDGELVSHAWKLVGAPVGSAAVLSSATTSSSSFSPDLPGTYIVELVVIDDAGAIAFDQVTFEATAVLVTANAGADTTIGWLARGQVTGTVAGSDGSTPTVTWTMTARPFYSTATLVNAATLTPSFIADAQGTYTLKLTATSGGVTTTDLVNVTASTVGQSFGAPDFDDPVTVVYSAALDRLIVVRRNPASVSVIDPATGLGPSVVLPIQFPEARSIALQPSGLRAAIGAPFEVAIVNLQTVSVEQVFDVVSNNNRIVFGPDNRVHSMPEDTSENILTLNVGTGAVTEIAPFSNTPGWAMHPAGAAMYLLDSFASRIARYDIASTPIALQRQASPATIYAPLYGTSDGASLITGNGIVLHSSTSAGTDMTVRGSLMTTNIESLTHSSVTHEIATVSSTAEPRLLSWFSDATFARRFTAAFVEPTTLNGYYSGFIAYRADGARMYIVGHREGAWTVFTVSPPP
ncbi:MAG: hypothetical protein H0T42_20185 [Deltaproteobacteria bacterium]|nr:hypothetical protein [Deltaproteobacteria bacterium]